MLLIIQVIYRVGGYMAKFLIVCHTNVNVYCPECPPRGTIGHPGGQQECFCCSVMEGT